MAEPNSRNYSHPCCSPRYSLEGSLNAFEGKDVENDTGANLELEKLQIGSSLRGNNNHGSHFINRFSPSSVTSTSYPGDDSGPLWKDYPMVHKGIPSSYSYCSMPTSSYSNSMLSPPSVFRNYRSSSMATIFGGPKPLISPPKLEVGFGFAPSLLGGPESCSLSPAPAFSCYSGQGRHSWSYGSPAESVMPIYLTSPLSRSSSQSSGFISQKGFNTPPPSTVNYSAVPVGPHAPRDPEGLSLYPESYIGSCPPRPQIQNFQTDSFTSFSALSNYSPHECNSGSHRHNRHSWSSSAFTEKSMGPVSLSVASGSGRSLNGNTCSRFARKDVDSTRLNTSKRSYDIRSTAAPLFSDDEDQDGIDDDTSFKSALTSLAKLTHFSCKSRSSIGSSSAPTPAHLRLPRSKSKIRSGPFIRNLKATSLLDDKDKIAESLREHESEEGETTNQNKKDSSHPSSVLRQVFWNLSLLLNIIIIFWVCFNYDFKATESQSQWVHNLIQNVTSEIVTSTIIFRDYFHNTFLEILAAREIHNTSNGSPTIFVLNTEEL